MSNLPSAQTLQLAERYERAQNFWGKRPGRALWRFERACLGPVIEPLIGLHALEFSAAEPLLPLAQMRHSMRWAAMRGHAESSSTLVCDPSSLPLEDECLDLVIIHHLLEVVPEPHHLLREAARVMLDHGKLVIIGWQPLGIGALRYLGPKRNKSFPFDQKWRSVHRLKDWLAFVDFEIERVDYCAFSLSPHGGGWESLLRRYNLPFGHSFVILARRKRLRMIPLKPRFVPRLMIRPNPIGLNACRQRCENVRHQPSEHPSLVEE